jgi:YqaJ-like viral recombinase domain
MIAKGGLTETRDNMAKVPTALTMSLLERAIEDRVLISWPRPYLGMSMLGEKCARHLWYYLHWTFTESHTPRVQRLFARGHREEPIIIRDLAAAGCRVYGEQDEITHGPYMRGHPDGIVANVPDSPNRDHLLECKTMKSTEFVKLRKAGVQESNPKHYAQANVYAHKLALTRILYIAVNKDTDERHYERLHTDNQTAQFLLNRGEDIVNATVPPQKINESPSWYECRFCPAKEVCHYGALPVVSCRTCAFHSKTDAGWFCTKDNEILNEDQQRAACHRYSLTPGLSEESNRVGSHILSTWE